MSNVGEIIPAGTFLDTFNIYGHVHDLVYGFAAVGGVSPYFIGTVPPSTPLFAVANGDSEDIFGYANDGHQRNKFTGLLDSLLSNVSNQPGSTTDLGDYSGAIDISTYAGNISKTTGNFEWTASFSGNFSDATKWNQYLGPTNTATPNAVGAAVNLLNQPWAATSITLNTGVTLGTVNFANGTASYTLTPSGGNTLTMNNSGNGALIADWQGTHNVNVPLVLADNLTLTALNATDTLNIGGAISGSYSLQKLGRGCRGPLRFQQLHRRHHHQRGHAGRLLCRQSWAGLEWTHD